VDVPNSAVKDLIVGIHANSFVMPKSAIELLDAENLAREGGQNVDMDVQRPVQSRVGSAMSLSRTFACHAVTTFPS